MPLHLFLLLEGGAGSEERSVIEGMGLRQDERNGAMPSGHHAISRCLHIVFSAPVAPSRGAREIVQSPVNTGGWDGAKHFRHRFCNG